MLLLSRALKARVADRRDAVTDRTHREQWGGQGLEIIQARWWSSIAVGKVGAIIVRAAESPLAVNRMAGYQSQERLSPSLQNQPRCLSEA